jgi:hypothetical protein
LSKPCNPYRLARYGYIKIIHPHRLFLRHCKNKITPFFRAVKYSPFFREAQHG